MHTMTSRLEQTMGLPFNAASTLGQEGIDRVLEIGQALQTTLELEQIIDLFSTEVKRTVAHDGIEYLNPAMKLGVCLGEKARNRCSYRLVIGEENLGELVFRRRKKFSEDDTHMLEYMLCSLLYPLRNALLYRDAVSRAQKDALTGAYNRAAMDDTLRREIDLAKRHNNELSLIVIDIDNFKTINDSHGHQVGDCVIKEVVRCAEEAIRSADMLFRYGGEEFVVLLRNTDRDGAELLANRMRKKVARMTCKQCGPSISATISAGVATLKKNDDARSLFHRADSALYHAKQNGRNQVTAG